MASLRATSTPWTTSSECIGAGGGGRGAGAGGGGAGKGESGGGGQREALGEGCALIKSYGSGHRAPGFEPRPRSSSLM